MIKFAVFWLEMGGALVDQRQGDVEEEDTGMNMFRDVSEDIGDEFTW